MSNVDHHIIEILAHMLPQFKEVISNSTKCLIRKSINHLLVLCLEEEHLWQSGLFISYAPDHCFTKVAHIGCQAYRSKLLRAQEQITQLNPPVKLGGFYFMGAFEEFFAQTPDIYRDGLEDKWVVEVVLYTVDHNCLVPVPLVCTVSDTTVQIPFEQPIIQQLPKQHYTGDYCIYHPNQGIFIWGCSNLPWTYTSSPSITQLLSYVPIFAPPFTRLSKVRLNALSFGCSANPPLCSMKANFMRLKYLWPSLENWQQVVEAAWHVEMMNKNLVALPDEPDDIQRTYTVLEVAVEDIEMP